MKACPSCGSRNQRDNIFCPMCAHSFLDEPEKHVADREAPHLIVRRGGRREVTVLIVLLIIVLGLGAGLTSYYVSRQIDRSSLVPVKSGVVFKCSRCGKLYKERVANLWVKKSDQIDYGVETATGLCYTCKYGPLVGGYQDMFMSLSKKGYYHGFATDIADPAAVFINANPALFPASSVDRVAAVATRVDPRLILKDFQQYAGKPVAVTATIVGLEVVTVPGGGTATYLQLEPVGNKDPANLELLALYKGTAPVLKGDTADCYLLPSDLVAYHSKKGDGKAILCIAMFLNPVRTP